MVESSIVHAMAVRMAVKSWQSLLVESHLLRKEIERVETSMQEFFPGPYTIEEYYDANLGRFNYRLKFEDPKQELLWKIKYP